MSEKTKVYAVQMVEYNPQAGNARKTFTVSGVMSFKAGNAVKGTTFVPSPIVPIKDPTKLIKVGEKMVPLFELLTGKDPEQPDTYYLSQPGKPNLPVFRKMVADGIDELKAAVDKQAQARAQVGHSGVPAPIVGVRGATERAKEPQVKTVEQILEEGRNVTGDEQHEEKPADAPPPADFRSIVAAVNDRSMPSRMGVVELETIKASLSADDLTFIHENGAAKLRDWARREMDSRAAPTKTE
ncbi:MAG: hypothetical protein PHX83_06930 [Acidobacteriia bacterium]|nr:hypothetical protein [Terriglobia bacterium]